MNVGLKYVIKESLKESYRYQDYRELVSNLAENGKSTGPQQTDVLTKYTQLNDARMRRWDKTLKISEELTLKIATLKRPITFLVLTESWCGDAAPSLTVFNKIAELSNKITLLILLRDENLELMENFLTNNALSIPKLILWDDALEEVIASWGPRPIKATEMVADYKTANGLLTQEFRESLQMWYNVDKGKSILTEVVGLLPLE